MPPKCGPVPENSHPTNNYIASIIGDYSTDFEALTKLDILPIIPHYICEPKYCLHLILYEIS
jgi:hypothetical protein